MIKYFPIEAHLLLQAPDAFDVPVPPPFGEGSEGKKEKPAYYRGFNLLPFFLLFHFFFSIFDIQGFGCMKLEEPCL